MYRAWFKYTAGRLKPRDDFAICLGYVRINSVYACTDRITTSCRPNIATPFENDRNQYIAESSHQISEQLASIPGIDLTNDAVPGPLFCDTNGTVIISGFIR